MIDAHEKIREAIFSVPNSKWTASGATVTIPETDDWPGKQISIRGLDKQVSRRLARYLATVNPAAINALVSDYDRMRATLEYALAWHESQDKAISKQPNANTGHKGWMRASHQEQADMIKAALGIEGERNDY